MRTLTAWHTAAVVPFKDGSKLRVEKAEEVILFDLERAMGIAEGLKKSDPEHPNLTMITGALARPGEVIRAPIHLDGPGYTPES